MTTILPIIGLLFAQTACSQQFVGNYASHAVRADSVIFSCESASILLEFCSESIVKVKYIPAGALRRDTSLVAFYDDWPAVNFTVQDFADSVNLQTNSLTITCRKRPFRLLFRERGGRLLLQERPAGGLGWKEAFRYAHFHQTPDEHFYGFGERGIDFDRKGHRFESYNRQKFGYNSALATMNMLGMSMSGVAYQHSDLSGFTGNPSLELYVRWMQLGAFSPIARAHGADDTHQTEPWAYGATAEAIVKRYLQLRYRLLPYSYTMAHENHTTGMPLARPLVLEYPDDPNVYNLGHEYLWGADFLVAPVTQAGATSRRVYLPQGEWVDYWTDKIYSGSTTINASAPLETMPLFVKKGAIVPLQNVMNYTGEFTLDTLTLAIYPAQRSSFTLYEDDGKTTAYRSGAFAQTTFICDVQPQAVTINIGRRSGDYAGKPNRRVYFTEVHHINHLPDSVMKNTRTLQSYVSVDELQRSDEGWWYDAARQLLVVKCQTVPSDDYVLRSSGNDLVSLVSSEPTLPTFFQLHAPHPNPFAEVTQIAYQLTERATVQVEIFNLVGQRLKALINTTQPAGEHTVAWRGDDERGLPVAAGVYVVRVKVNAGAEEFLASRKISVLR